MARMAKHINRTGDDQMATTKEEAKERLDKADKAFAKAARPMWEALDEWSKARKAYEKVCKKNS